MPEPRHRPTARAVGRRTRGQALVEFAIVLPVFLALVGVTVDFARLFQTWMALQSATRDAAESVAWNATVNDQTTATAAVAGILCQRMDQTTATTCPRLATSTTFSIATGTTQFPAATVAVTSRYDFQALFIYPVLPVLTGSKKWVLTTSVTYQILRGK